MSSTLRKLEYYLQVIERRLIGSAKPPAFTPPAPPVAAITAALAQGTLASIGDATATSVRDANSVDVTAGCTFTSNNTATATVDASGNVTAVANGSASITATQTSTGLTSSVTVTVAQAVASAGISPSTVTLARGDTQQFTLSPADARGHPIASPPTPTWMTGDNNSGATFGPISAAGLWTAETGSPGHMSGFLHATYPNGVVSQNAGLTVATPALTSVTPSSYPQGSSAQSFTIAGSGFADDSVVSGGTGVTVTDYTRVNAGQINGHLNVASGTATGANSLAIVSAALSVSLSAALTITAAGLPTSPISVVQSQSAFASAAASLAVTYTTAPTHGNMLVVTAQLNSATATLGMTDSQGNTWTALSVVNTTDGTVQQKLWYLLNAPGGALTLTFTNSDATKNIDVVLAEVANIDATGALDLSATATGNSTTPTVTAAGPTVSGYQEIEIAAFVNNFGVLTPPTGFTAFASSAANGGPYTQMSYRIISSVETPSAAATDHVGPWAGILAVFKGLLLQPAVVTTVTVSPASFSILTTGTQQLTATTKDQYGRTMTGRTYSWSSSNSSVATVNASGLVSGVGAGSCTITATDSGVTSAAVTATVTTTGSATMDPSNPTTGAGILGTNVNALPVWWDYANAYDSDTGGTKPWKGQISSAISTLVDATAAGTATGSNTWPTNMRYGDGRYVDLGRWVSTPDAAYGPQFSEHAFEQTLLAQNVGAETPTGEVGAVLDNSVRGSSWWTIRRKAMCSTPPFTGVGDGNSSAAITYDGSQAAAFKSGPSTTSVGTGSSRLETTNWTNSGASGGPDGDYILQVSEAVDGGGIIETIVGRTDAAYRSGALELEAVFWESWIRGSDSSVWLGGTLFRKRATDPNWVQVGPRVTYNATAGNAAVGGTPVTARPVSYEVAPTSLNYNQARSTNLKYWWTHCAFWNADTNGFTADPAGILAYIKTLAPDTPSAVTVTGATTSTVPLTVTRGRFTGSLRCKMDGVWITGQDYVMKREDGELVQTNAGGADTTGKVSFSLTGLALATGTHTVTVFAISGDGATIEATGHAQTFTV